MKNTVKERLTEYLKFKGVTKSAFGREVEVSAAYVNSITRTISPDILKRIRLKYPDLNTDWLLLGEGEMLKTQSTNSVITGDVSGNGNQIVAGNNNVLRDKEVTYTAEPKAEDAEIIETLEAIPIVSLEQAKAPDFDVKRHVFGKSSEIERKNFNEWFVTIIKQVGLFDVVSPVVSDRMMPTYMPNDRIFSKYLLHATNDTYIEQGIYLLDTDSGNVLCNVRDLDDGTLELTFDNSRKYRPRIIHKRKVKSIAQVVMTLRFGTMAFDVMDVAQLQQQMEVKDEQYRLLMEQYNKTGDRVNRVIDQNQRLINTLIDVVKKEK